MTENFILGFLRGENFYFVIFFILFVSFWALFILFFVLGLIRFLFFLSKKSKEKKRIHQRLEEEKGEKSLLLEVSQVGKSKKEEAKEEKSFVMPFVPPVKGGWLGSSRSIGEEKAGKEDKTKTQKEEPQWVKVSLKYTPPEDKDKDKVSLKEKLGISVEDSSSIVSKINIPRKTSKWFFSKKKGWRQTKEVGGIKQEEGAKQEEKEGVLFEKPVGEGLISSSNKFKETKYGKKETTLKKGSQKWHLFSDKKELTRSELKQKLRDPRLDFIEKSVGLDMSALERAKLEKEIFPSLYGNVISQSEFKRRLHILSQKMLSERDPKVKGLLRKKINFLRKIGG